MKITKRIITMLLAMVLFAGLLPAQAPVANAAISTTTFNTKVQEFLKDSRWKNGIAWADAQKPKLSGWSSTGCCAYAADFAAYVYGATNSAWSGSNFTKFTNLNEIRTGDIIHTSNHWFVVLGRTGDTFYTAEGNFDDKVRVTTSGWGIKNGVLYNLKATDGARTFMYGYHYNFSDSGNTGSGTTSNSSKQIYYNIDMSAAVLKSRINQQVSGDCAVVSMATVEAYLYGATSTANKNTVYNALVTKNTDNDYAYWSNCGYVSHSSVNWTTVYNQLSMGYPVIVHRPATSSKVQHWAVVAGYKGSTTTLEKDKFIIVDVYHGSGGTDIYTSAAWRGSTSIDRMVTRKNGISITSLSGIQMAINHPKIVHQSGEGHGVYGYITSNSNLTSIQFLVTNANTGAHVYNKTITPNAKSYQIYKLDSEFTFAKWATGEYFFTVIAKNGSTTRNYQTYFRIVSGWPTTLPTRPYTFAYNYSGAIGNTPTQTVVYGGNFSITSDVPVLPGFTFQGWNVRRTTDGKIYCNGPGWCTDAQISANGYTPRLYKSGEKYSFGYEWIRDCFNNTGYTFFPVWEIDQNVLPNVPDAGSVSGSVTSYLEDGEITIDLFREGEDTAAYSATVTGIAGEATSFIIPGVENGTYTMVVSKNNHVSGTYTVTVGSESIAPNVTLFAYGDVTGDGKVNMKDWSSLYDHIAELDTLSGYALQCGDVNGDGKVNMKDWSRLYDHISESNPLW